MQKIIDLSYHNVSEQLYKNGKPAGVAVHPFDWAKAIAQGVTGSIVKCSEGDVKDIAYDSTESNNPLAYRGTYFYVKYTKTAYQVGDEVEWGKIHAQTALDLSDKYPHNVRVAIDLEQNAKWEKLENTNTDQALNRALKIALYAAIEIERLAGYWPLVYTNRNLTKYMHNFTQCPLWIATGSEKPPKYSNWTEHAIQQVDWLAPGRDYGNYIGNQTIDINWCEDPAKILIPGKEAFSMGEEAPAKPAQESSYPKLTVKTLALIVRTGPGTNFQDTKKRVYVGATYDVYKQEIDANGNPWALIEPGWVCVVYYGSPLAKIS